MKTAITKWGNSQGIRLPKSILDAVSMREGEEVEIKAVDDTIVIYPAKKALTLKDLFEGYEPPEPSEPITEIDWGPPCGEEVW